jgi:hypothetical protein
VSGGPGEHISLAAGAEDIGLASMLADLIRQNLEQNPRKGTDFSRLSTAVAMDVRDAEVMITLVFSRGSLVIHAGIHGAPEIRIRAGAETLLALPRVRIVGGLPHLFGPDGRGLRNGLLTGAVKIHGMFRHPVKLVRLTRLMSVNG